MRKLRCYRKSAKVLLVLCTLATIILLGDVLRLPSGLYDIHLLLLKNWTQRFHGREAQFSELGRRLYLQDTLGEVITNRTFKISVWEFGPRLERRMIRHFGAEKHDPFDKCSAKNCMLTYDNNDSVIEADAVLIHLHLTKGVNSLPKVRTPSQRWIFLTDENPQNTFQIAPNKLKDYNGLFNWSMTYRSDSDIPVPYGRNIPLPTALSQIVYTNKTKMVAVMGSNCGGSNNRWGYVKALSKHIQVDIYGKCGTLKCPGHFQKDCPAINDYKFYLAFENGNCEEYMTEKLWWNSYSKGVVPVVMGAPKEYYEKLCPPHSFIHVDDFDSPEDLAKYLKLLLLREDLYRQYFDWTKHFEIKNEHGYFGSDIYHYCRICQALNYNSPSEKVYWDLEQFWNRQKDCFPSKWK